MQEDVLRVWGPAEQPYIELGRLVASPLLTKDDLPPTTFTPYTDLLTASQRHHLLTALQILALSPQVDACRFVSAKLFHELPAAAVYDLTYQVGMRLFFVVCDPQRQDALPRLALRLLSAYLGRHQRRYPDEATSYMDLLPAPIREQIRALRQLQSPETPWQDWPPAERFLAQYDSYLAAPLHGLLFEAWLSDAIDHDQAHRQRAFALNDARRRLRNQTKLSLAAFDAEVGRYVYAVAEAFDLSHLPGPALIFLLEYLEVGIKIEAERRQAIRRLDIGLRPWIKHHLRLRAQSVLAQGRVID